MNGSKKRILFLCTGNYYRSRFAEILFNHLAASHKLDWLADSRGLRVRPDGEVNVGSLSPFAEAGLEMRSIPVPEPGRYPQQAGAADFAVANHIVAVKELEHRPLMEALFPEIISRVEFWNIHDLDAAHPLDALRELEGNVAALVTRLRT